jgi:indoleacetamide hydrolase
VTLAPSFIREPLKGLARMNGAVNSIISFYEARIELTKYLERWIPQVTFDALALQTASPEAATILRGILHEQSRVSSEEYRRAVQIDRPLLISAYRDYFEKHELDAIVYPATPKPACLRSDGDLTELGGTLVATFATYIRNTDPGSNAGLPGATLLVSLTGHGLPVGLALDAMPGEDARLLALCSSIEAVLPRIPPPDSSDCHTYTRIDESGGFAESGDV